MATLREISDHFVDDPVEAHGILSRIETHLAHLKTLTIDNQNTLLSMMSEVIRRQQQIEQRFQVLERAVGKWS